MGSGGATPTILTAAFASKRANTVTLVATTARPTTCSRTTDTNVGSISTRKRSALEYATGVHSAAASVVTLGAGRARRPIGQAKAALDIVFFVSWNDLGDIHGGGRFVFRYQCIHVGVGSTTNPTTTERGRLLTMNRMP